MPASPRKPYVHVTLEGPDDGGDFGPRTPGTRTGGIQEALDWAHAHGRDVHVHGGRGGLHQGRGMADNVYELHETLRVPWSQDFTLYGGNYLLAYLPHQGSAVHIDSQMNCRYKFGLVSSASPDPAVLVRPRTPGPDDFVAITASVLDFSAIVSHHPGGTALRLDSADGPIVNSRILAEETNSLGTGVHLSDAGGQGYWIANNRIQIPYGNQYHASGSCTGLQLGDRGTCKILHNHLDLSLHAPRGAFFDEEKREYATREDFAPADAVGARLHAQRNVLALSFYGRRAPGQDLVFEEEARDNCVHLSNLPNGFTSRARVPSNRLRPAWPVGFALPTPPVPPSDAWTVNDTGLAAQVLVLEPGQVSSWTLEDAGRTPQDLPFNLSLVDTLRRPPRPQPPPEPAQAVTVSAALFAGQTFVLEPGDRVRLVYDRPPAWRWKALGS